MLALLSIGVLTCYGNASAAVYWANNYSVARVNLDRTFLDTNFIGRFTPPGEIYNACGVAVNATHVYWADASRNVIGRANLDGTVPEYGFATGANEPCGVAVNATHVYWANRNGGGIGRAKLDGTEVTPSFIPDAVRPCAVAVNQTHIFWASAWTDSIGRVEVDGSDVSPEFIDEADGACGIAVNQTHVFWGTYFDAIGRARLDGTEPDFSFITGLYRPCGVAVDQSHIYWSEESVGFTGRVGRALLDGEAVDPNFVIDVASGCGTAVDSVSFVPRDPYAEPPSRFSLGKVRRNKRKGIAFLAVDVPAWGVLKVPVVTGVDTRIVPELHRRSSFTTGGRKWVRISPAGIAAGGRKIRRRLERHGRSRVEVQISYGEKWKIPVTKSKWLTLLQMGDQRGATTRGKSR